MTRDGSPARLALIRELDSAAGEKLAAFERWAAGLKLDSGERWELAPFQRSFLADVFGGAKVAWLVVPEGNGKSTLVAGLALWALEQQPHAMVLAAASSRDQAMLIYRQAEGLVLRAPHLHERVESAVAKAKGKATTETPRFKPLEGYRRIVHANGARLQVMAADDSTGDGVIPDWVLLDELHRQKDLGLYRTWTSKLQKRGGQAVVISTAGEPGGEFERVRQEMLRSSGVEREGCFARAVGDGWVLHDWALGPDDDALDMDLVAAANPLPSVTAEVLAAKRALPGMTDAHWRRFSCNLPTRSVTSAVTEQEWDAIRVEEWAPIGEPVDVGLDVAWKWDTTALVPLWTREDGVRVLGEATVLEPPRDGSSLDPALVEAAILRLHARNPIRTLVMDPTRAEQLAVWAADATGALVVEFGQGNAKAALAHNRFMEGMCGGGLKHTGCPLLKQHAMNAISRLLPYGDSRFDRPKTGRLVTGEQADARVIDALVAAAMVNAVAADPGSHAAPFLLVV